jgi:hypothetical protein
MRIKIGRLLGFLLMSELTLAVASYELSHGRFLDTMNLFSGIQLALLIFACYIFLAVKYARKFPSTKPKPGFINAALALLVTVLAIALAVVWYLQIFPSLVKLTLQHYGVNSLASIQRHAFVDFGPKASEFSVMSADSADAVNVQLEYDGHSASIQVPKNDPAFSLVNGATYPQGKIPVRYLPLIPGIVVPEADLGS